LFFPGHETLASYDRRTQALVQSCHRVIRAKACGTFETR